MTTSAVSRSTLAEGLHVYPPFYACYMLRSYKVQHGKGNRRTYIGSTPDPPRRWRQHNGEITGGAWKTKLWRPWEMEAICYNFPSKLVALQFEWAWNAPFASRHLRAADREPMFSKSVGTGPEARIRVLQAMLAARPWSRFPLKVMLFSREIRDVWDRCLQGEVFSKNTRKWKAGTASTELSHVQVTHRFIGVDGGRLGRREAAETFNKDPLSVSDSEAVIEQYEKLEALKEGDPTPLCGRCSKPVNLDDPLSFTLCTSTPTCHYVAHLRCIAPHFLSNDSPEQILPDRGICPGCQSPTRWGELIKGAFHRQPAGAKARARKALELGEAAAEAELAEDDDGEVYPAKRRKAARLPTKKVISKQRSTKGSRSRKVRGTVGLAVASAAAASEDEDSEDFGSAMDAIHSGSESSLSHGPHRGQTDPEDTLAKAVGAMGLASPSARRLRPYFELSD